MGINIGRSVDAGSSVARGSITITMLGESQYILFELRWMLLLAMALILADFWFGISVSKYLGKPIRKSRACRRTLNKFVDYLCYLLVAAFLGMALGDPLGLKPVNIAMVSLLMCYGFEIDSIYSHVCELHGVKNGVSIWRILILLITLRFNSLKDILSDLENNIQARNKYNNKDNT